MDNKTDLLFYNSIHDIWEELEATLQEMKLKTDEGNNLVTFMQTYVALLHDYSNTIERLRYGKEI